MRNGKAYGIYLGAEYASIACAENGIVSLVKIDVTDDFMPCCVYFNPRGEAIVGKKAQQCAKSEYKRSILGKTPLNNTFYDFRRTMGTDKRYVSANIDGKEYSSEELSAEVLKALKSFITDEDFKSVVITVPAKFTVNQKAATVKAAKLAGFNHVELLQEPIAAAMAYGLSSAQKDGYWLVFDFGGGTFDAALIKVEDGIIQVFDTEGDNYLGGKNLDYAIVDNILMPYLQENYSIDGFLEDTTKKDILREAMKTYAEEIKNELSFKDSYSIYVDPGDLGEDEDGEEFEIDLTITKDEVYNVIRPLFQKAVDICKDLLKRNNLNTQQLGKLILVGSSSNAPLLRQLLKDQVSSDIEHSINFMTAFSEGAALWTEKLMLNNMKLTSTSHAIVLDIPYDSFVSDDSVWIPVSLASNDAPVSVQFVRSDGWHSQSILIDKCGDVIELDLQLNTKNLFSIQCQLSDGTFVSNIPGYIEITNGIVDDFSPRLPYTFATEGIKDGEKITNPIIGLERNAKIPACGIFNNLKINLSDFHFPLYQCDQGCEMKSIALSEYIGELTLPQNTVLNYLDEPVDVTIRIDRAEMITADLYIPSKDCTIPLVFKVHTNAIIETENFIAEEISKALLVLKALRHKGKDVSVMNESLKYIISSFINGEDVISIKLRLKEILKKIY